MFLSRLRLESDRKDFMYHILNSKGPAATPKELASHYNVIMMAGAVTTATFLSSVLYYLGHNRQALGRLQNELRSTFPSLADINSKNLLDCVYVNAVVEEGLRIYPPAGAAHLSRIVPQGGCEISGKPSLKVYVSNLFRLFSGFSLSFTSPTLHVIAERLALARLAYLSILGPFCATLPTSTSPPNSSQSAGSRPRRRVE